MKIKLKKPNEWGHFIDSDSLEIRELVGEIPNDSLVIIRRREFRSELGRNVIITLYANISKNLLVYIGKKGFEKELAKKCSHYMLEKNEIPPKVNIATMDENKPVKLFYSFSRNEIFQFQITEQLLGGKNPKDFIENLIASSDRDFYKAKVEKSWLVEYAPNGRALCKKCKRQIKSKEIRFGELQKLEDQLIQQFYHFKCIDWSNLKEIIIQGVDNLFETDQEHIRKKLKTKK